MQARAASEGKTVEQLSAELRRRAESGSSDSRYRGPSAAQIELHDWASSWRDWLLNVGVAALRVLPVVGRPDLEDYRTVRLPNIPQMVDTLMRVHGAQLMWDGVLNVDPHAGNFLLLQEPEPEPEPELEPAVASAAGSPGSPTRAAAAGRRDGSGRRKSAWGRGRIGLIDYGATHRLTREERLIAGLYTPLVYQRMHAHAN
jgi:hypothetical protein